jgi:HK97 gp10 family phage protein
MSTEFEVTGLDILLRKLENMGKEGSLIQDESLIEAVQPILQDEKNTTLFKDRSGKLRKSLKISKVKKSKNGKVVWIGDIDKQANYSWYVEYGHSSGKMPRPFMSDAYKKNKDTVYQKVKDAIEKNLQK